MLTAVNNEPPFTWNMAWISNDHKLYCSSVASKPEHEEMDNIAQPSCILNDATETFAF